MLKNIFNILVAVPLLASPSLAKDDGPEFFSEVLENYTEVITNLAPHAKYVKIGDSDHTNRFVRDFLSSGELMRSLAERGITNLCIEVPQRLDYMLAEYQDGTIDADTFNRKFDRAFYTLNQGFLSEQEVIKSIQLTMDNAQLYGIIVHAVDPGIDTAVTLSEDESKTLRSWIERYEQSTGNKLDFTSSAKIDEMFRYVIENKLSSEQEVDLMINVAERTLRGRLDDTILAENIEAACGNGNGAIIYGYFHDDLIEKLDGDVLIVDAYASGRAYHNCKSIPEWIETEKGKAHLMITIDDQRVFTSQKGIDFVANANFEIRSRQPANGYFLGLPIDPPKSNCVQ